MTDRAQSHAPCNPSTHIHVRVSRQRHTGLLFPRGRRIDETGLQLQTTSLETKKASFKHRLDRLGPKSNQDPLTAFRARKKVRIATLVQHSTSTAQHSTVRHSTARHSTVLSLPLPLPLPLVLYSTSLRACVLYSATVRICFFGCKRNPTGNLPLAGHDTTLGHV